MALTRCPKCQGNVTRETRTDPPGEYCIQCGWEAAGPLTIAQAMAEQSERATRQPRLPVIR